MLLIGVLPERLEHGLKKHHLKGENMKRLILVLLTIVFLAGTASAWTLKWDAVTGADNILFKMMAYPDGYGTQFDNNGNVTNPAAEELIKAQPAIEEATLPGDAVKYDIQFLVVTGKRYVFYLQSVDQESVSGHSDHLAWTAPIESKVVEMPLSSGSNIQINIYQAR